VIKAIIFDCFGVLVGKGFEYTYSLAGGDPGKDRRFIDDILGQANLGLISDNEFRVFMADRLGISVNEWIEAVKSAELPDLELLAYIKILKKKYKTAVLSNANRGVLKRKIGQKLLDSCFDEVIVSAEVGMIKPDPEIYKLVVKRLGVKPEECVFIDDKKSFTEVGESLGMKAVHFKSTLQFQKELNKLIA
jgi:epoxide hydrolase-like predicted phosphatase